MVIKICQRCGKKREQFNFDEYSYYCDECSKNCEHKHYTIDCRGTFCKDCGVKILNKKGHGLSY